MFPACSRGGAVTSLTSICQGSLPRSAAMSASSAGQVASRREMLGQIVEPDLVLLAAPVPIDELARCGAQRFFRVENVRSGARLITDDRIDLQIVAVELGEFRRDIA